MIALSDRFYYLPCDLRIESTTRYLTSANRVTGVVFPRPNIQVIRIKTSLDITTVEHLQWRLQVESAKEMQRDAVDGFSRSPGNNMQLAIAISASSPLPQPASRLYVDASSFKKPIL